MKFAILSNTDCIQSPLRLQLKVKAATSLANFTYPWTGSTYQNLNGDVNKYL